MSPLRTPGPGVAGQPPRWRRWLRRHRRLLATGLAATAALLAVRTARPEPAPTEPVLVVSHDIAPGALIAAQDVTVAHWPAGLVPPDALRAPADLPDRPVATRIGTGEVLLPARFVSPALVGAYGSGLVATPVRLADSGATALLHTGDLVDVLAAAPSAAGDPVQSPARVVASAVRVLLAGTADRTSSEPFSADLGASEGSLIVLATTPSTAATIAGAATTSRLSIILRAG